MKKIVLFDWGGVLALSDNKIAAEILHNEYDIDKDVFMRYCKKNEDMYGDSDFDGGFLEQASKEFNVPKENIANALNSAEPHEGYVLARQVAQNHKTYLVSNQIKFRTDFIRSSFALSFFEKLYFSNEIQHLKPHKGFFQYILADIGVDSEQCIFIDDNSDNIQSAKELGFGTIHVVSVEQMKTELDHAGLL